MFEYGLFIFIVYIGVTVIVVLFGTDKQARRGQVVLRELLSVFKHGGSGGGTTGSDR